MKRLKSLSVTTVSLLLLLATVLTVLGAFALASHEVAMRPAYADDDDTPDDQSTLSFYSCASAFAQVTGYVTSPDYNEQTGNHEDKNVEKSGIAKWWHVKQARDLMHDVSAGTAGSFLGYYDAGDGNGFWGFIQTLASGTSTSYTYKMLFDLPNVNKTGESPQHAFIQYAIFGRGLYMMGFDDTAGSSLGVIRITSGALFFLAFIVAFIVDAVFKAVMFILNLLNPFSLFKTVATFSSFASMDAPNSGFGSTLVTMISDLYDAIAGLSLAVILPVFIALFAFTLLVLRNTAKAKSQFKKIVIRLLFIAIGIPLLAAVYSACLEQLDNVTTSASAAVEITGSTFFDFNAFVYGKDSKGFEPMKLANNLGFDYDPDPNTVNLNMAYTNLQNYCWDQNWADDAVPYVSNPSYTMSGSHSTLGDSDYGAAQGGATFSDSGFDQCISLINRYMFSDKISASEFESAVKTNYDIGSANAETARLFAGLRRVRYGEYDPEDSYEENDEYGLFSFFDAGAAKDDKNDDKRDDLTVFKAFVTQTSVPSNMKNLVHGTLHSNINWVAHGRGSRRVLITFYANDYMSQLGTYNYLNTYFESKSLTCYSPSNAASLFVMRQHYQVNMIGTGMIRFMYWLNGCVMLWCIAILGLLYGIGILMGNIKRGIKILLQVPFAALGAMKSIARVIAWTVMMMIEIMVTLFLYSFITAIFMQIPHIIASPITNVMSGRDVDDTASIVVQGTPMAVGSYILAVAVLLVSIIIEIVFTIMAIKLRKQVVKAVDEEAARIVEQVVGVAPGSASELPKQPGMLGNLASNALAAGAMAHALDVGTGGDSGGSAFEKSASTDTSDPARAPVGTGDGSEEQAQQDEEGDGEDGEGSVDPNGAQAGDEIEGDVTSQVSHTDGDTRAQEIARDVVQAGSLAGASAPRNITQGGDVVNETNTETDQHTEEGDETSVDESSGPVDINDADVARMHDTDAVAEDDERMPERGTYTKPVNLDNADVNRIVRAQRAKGQPERDTENEKRLEKDTSDSSAKESAKDASASKDTNKERDGVAEPVLQKEASKSAEATSDKNVEREPEAKQETDVEKDVNHEPSKSAETTSDKNVEREPEAKQETDVEKDVNHEPSKSAETTSDKNVEREPEAVRVGEPGKGGRGGDGAKGEEGEPGKDAEAGGRASVKSAEASKDAVANGVAEGVQNRQAPLVPGVMKDANGKLVHEDGTPATKAERNAYRSAEKAAERSERQASKDEARRVKALRQEEDAARVHEDGTPYTKAENRALHRREAAEVKAAQTVQAARENESHQKHAEKAKSAQRLADAERAEASSDGKMQTNVRNKRVAAERVIEERQTQYETRQTETRTKADSRRSAARENADTARQTTRVTADNARAQARATVYEERDRAFAAKMKQQFPQAVDASGNFHAEALTGKARTKAAVMQASHNVAMGASRTVQNAADTGRQTVRNVADAGRNTVRNTADATRNAARTAKDTVVRTSTSVGQKVVHESLGTVENAAGAAHTAHHTCKADAAQKDAVREARRSRMYVPEVQYDRTRDAGDRNNRTRQETVRETVRENVQENVETRRTRTEARGEQGAQGAQQYTRDSQRNVGGNTGGVNGSGGSYGRRDSSRSAEHGGDVRADRPSGGSGRVNGRPAGNTGNAGRVNGSSGGGAYGNANGRSANGHVNGTSGGDSYGNANVDPSRNVGGNAGSNYGDNANGHSYGDNANGRSANGRVNGSSGGGSYGNGNGRSANGRVNGTSAGGRGSNAGGNYGGSSYGNGNGRNGGSYGNPAGNSANGAYGNNTGNNAGANSTPRTRPTQAGANASVTRTRANPRQRAMKQFAAAAILSHMGQTGQAVANGLSTAATINMMGGVSDAGYGRNMAAAMVAAQMMNQQRQSAAERRRADERRVEDEVQRILNKRPGE